MSVRKRPFPVRKPRTDKVLKAACLVAKQDLHFKGGAVLQPNQSKLEIEMATKNVYRHLLDRIQEAKKWKPSTIFVWLFMVNYR
jgi:hypothetical protein